MSKYCNVCNANIANGTMVCPGCGSNLSRREVLYWSRDDVRGAKVKTNCKEDHKCNGGHGTNCDYFAVQKPTRKFGWFCLFNNKQGYCANKSAWPENQPTNEKKDGAE